MEVLAVSSLAISPALGAGGLAVVGGVVVWGAGAAGAAVGGGVTLGAGAVVLGAAGRAVVVVVSATWGTSWPTPAATRTSKRCCPT